MRSLVVAALAAAALVPASPASADDAGLTGTCVWQATTGTLAGYTIARGDAALTNVRCAVYENSTLLGSSSVTLPGSVAATEWNPELPIFPTRVCWSGYTYWSDGTFTSAGPSCRPV